ncbi:MAG: PadR family transcriptional regulator [bacterium]|nr:PadR family transcriptional regulator [bacterium]
MSHRYLVLGLLAERPMTGYDIKKHVKAMLSAVTNASYGTLYPTLHKLLLEGAVEVNEVPQKGRPSKKVYRLTETGRKELDGWLKQPPASDQVRREFLLKLYLAKDLSPQQLKSLVATRLDEAQAMWRALQAEKNEIDNPRQAWVMEYALSQCKAELDWLQQLEAKIGVA